MSCFSRLRIEEAQQNSEVTLEIIPESSFSQRKNNRHLTVGDINMPEVTISEISQEKSNGNLVYWAISRKNSPNIILDPFNRGEFQNAYDQVFSEGYFKQKSNDTILNKGIYVEDGEKEKKMEETVKYENFITFECHLD